jgi:hypothetical protein
MSEQKVCDWCGEAIPEERTTARSCSLSCAAHLGKQAEKRQYECQWCRVMFVPKAPGRTSFCCRDHAYKHKSEQALFDRIGRRLFPPKKYKVSCWTCDGWIFTNQPNTRRHPECSRMAQQWNLAPPIHERQCTHCDKAFTGNLKDAYCSDECQTAQAKDNKDQCKRRRLMRIAGGICVPYKRRDIFLRDGWKCWLCGGLTDRTKAAPHPLSPVLDHVTPIAKGGADSPDNVRCAHWGCNLDKSDTIVLAAVAG